MVVVEVNPDMLYELLEHSFSKEAVKRLIYYYDYEHNSYEPCDSDGIVLVHPYRIQYEWKEFLSPRNAVEDLRKNPKTAKIVKMAEIDTGEPDDAVKILNHMKNQYHIRVLFGCDNGAVLVSI